MHNSLNVFLFLAVVGAVETVWLMAILAHRRAWEPTFLRQLRRVSLAVTGLAFLWGAHYAFETEWEPWLPCIVVMAGVVTYLGLTIIAAYTPYNLPEALAQQALHPEGAEGSTASQNPHVRAAIGAYAASKQRAAVRASGTSGPSASEKRSESSATVF